MDKKYTYFRLEEFIIDKDFYRIVKTHYRQKDHSDEWSSLLHTYPEQQEVMQKAYLLINGIKLSGKDIPAGQIQSDWSLLQKKIRQRKRRTAIYWISSAAACFILVISGLYFFENQSTVNVTSQELLSRLEQIEVNQSGQVQIIYGENKITHIDKDASIVEKEDGSILVNDKETIAAEDKDAEYIQLIVPNGKRSFVELKDGTKIWVNSGTKLLYPSCFDPKKREIFVEGEVYLEVVRNELLPFFVHTSSLNVKVLGTSFNVSAYKDDPFVQVVLVSGSVEVNTTNDKKPIRLEPNMSYLQENDIVSVQSVDVYNYICWRDGIMKLEGEALDGVFRRLSRYYNVTINASPEIERAYYYGKLGLEETLENVLYNISLVEAIEYEREGETIFIRKKK